MSKQFYFKQIILRWIRSLNTKTILFQTTQFSISTQFSSSLPIDRILSGATTPGKSGPGSDDNEGILRILQSSSITGTSASDCLVSYPGHLLGEGLLPLCGEAVGAFYSPSRLGHRRLVGAGAYPSAEK